MKLIAAIIILTAIAITGCTVRGGWPRFLRWGESPGWNGPKSNSTRLDDIPPIWIGRDALLDALAQRDTQIIDLVDVGHALIARYGKEYALEIVDYTWKFLTYDAPETRTKDMFWLEKQGPRVRDVAWMVNYKNLWNAP
jgi:hypothetical protein